MAKKNKGNDDYSLDALAKLAQSSQTSITIGPTATSITPKNNNQDYASTDTTNDLSATQVPLLASMNSSIDVIRTDLSNTKDVMHGNVKDLRKEIEKKLDGKIDNIYFIGAVVVLVTIGGLFLTFSYTPLLERVDESDKKFVNMTLFNPLKEKVDSNTAFINSKGDFVSKKEFNSLKTIVDANNDSIKKIVTDTNGT